MAQARQAAAKVTAALPAAVTKRPNSTGVPPPYRRLWRQLDADCGSGWQQQYADLHADIVAGRRPERIVVSLATPTGARHNSCCQRRTTARAARCQHHAGMLVCDGRYLSLLHSCRKQPAQRSVCCAHALQGWRTGCWGPSAPSTTRC